MILIYDFDDTLIYSFENCVKYLQFTTENMGLRIPKINEFKERWNTRWEELIEKTLSGVTTEEFNKVYFSLELPFIYPAVESAIDTINYASERFLIGILSGRSKIFMSHKYDDAGIDLKKFRFIFAMEDTKFYKPDPRVFNRVKELNGNNSNKENYNY
jgi:FMN phosphatase YigB (HAD superfamily)